MTKEKHPCICGCGRETGGLYAPGHDLRVKMSLASDIAAEFERAAKTLAIIADPTVTNDEKREAYAAYQARR